MIDYKLAKRVYECIDNTLLGATDNEKSVEMFCRHTREMVLADGSHVASVCVYPRFVRVTRRALEGTGIAVVSVAGGFPHGQLPLGCKVEEVKYAVGEGADEIDVVLNRGLLLAGEENEVVEEIAAMKQACGTKTMKVIIETCDLPSSQLIERATMLAIDGGADFVKTSTGKAAAGASPEAAMVMLNAIKDKVKISKKTVGFKAAGGIKMPSDALIYAETARKIMGDEYVNKQTFRIGASSLTDGMFSILTK